MKKLLQRVFGVTASAVLLLISALPSALADDTHHSHHSGENILEVKPPEKGYTITLQAPDYKEGKAPSFGAYQIFTGTVENGGTTYDQPGDKLEKIPLTDIKWGNAFGNEKDTSDETKGLNAWRKNIVEFVYALAKTPTEAEDKYKAAFSDFHGFDGDTTDGDKTGLNYETFAGNTENTLADRFYYDESVPKNGTIEAEERRNDNVNFDRLATEVADVIEAHQDRTWLQAFTDILGGYGDGYSDDDGAHQGYVIQCYDKDGKWEDTAKTYTMTVPEGYYMVLDTTDLGVDSGSHTDDTDESYSARMLFVANNITQQIKQDVPSLTKTISRDGGYYDTEAAGVGDEVNFRLTGQLPSNYDQYTLGYQFTFTDELSKGLTLKDTEEKTGDSFDYNSVKVSVLGANVNGTWNADATFTISTTDISKTEHSHADSEVAYTSKVTVKEEIQTLEVYFPCLKEISKTEDDTTYTLGADSEIYIDYIAVVNENAIVSPTDGNKNTAKLTYSDNPQSYGDTDDTTEEHATVYTFGLDIVKVDAADFLKNAENPEAAGLSGAKFAVVRMIDMETDMGSPDPEFTLNMQIAKLKKFAKETEPAEPRSFEDTYYSIDEWENITIEITITDSFDFNDLNKSVQKGIDDFLARTDIVRADYEVETADEGKLLISGFDDFVADYDDYGEDVVGGENIYMIAETETPSDQYARIAPITVVFHAAQDADEYTGLLTNVGDFSNQIDDGESFSYDKFVQSINPETADDNGSDEMIVANFKYIDLPSTGGVGTYWFYILGAGGLAISFVLFRLSRKKIVQ